MPVPFMTGLCDMLYRLTTLFSPNKTTYAMQQNYCAICSSVKKLILHFNNSLICKSPYVNKYIEKSLYVIWAIRGLSV